MERLLAKTLEEKIAKDKKKSKRLEEVTPLDTLEKNQWEKTSKKTKWFIILAALTSFGGFFNSFAKRKYKKDKTTEE